MPKQPPIEGPRKRALENPEEPMLPYNPHGGHPITPELPGKNYQEQPPAIGGGSAKTFQTNPIKK